jgi:hypothetical protein
MMDFAKKAFKAVAPIAIDEGGKFLKGKIEGMGAKNKTKKHRKGKGFLDDIASGLIHVGIPTATTLAGTYLGGPVGGIVGDAVGNLAADEIGKATGRGMMSMRRRNNGGALRPAGY